MTEDRLIEILTEPYAALTGIAHVLCGVLIGEGLTSKDELAESLEYQAHHVGPGDVNERLMVFARCVRSYGGSFQVIEGGRTD